jgi:chromosome segregation ATPase
MEALERGNSDKKKELLEVLQMIARFRVEEHLDQSVEDLFRTGAPIWLTNGVVFNPLFASWEEEIMSLSEHVKGRQAELRRLVQSRRQHQARSHRPGIDEEKRRLEEEINSLENAIGEFSLNSVSILDQDSRHLSDLEDEIRLHDELYGRTKEEVDSLEEILLRYGRELEEATSGKHLLQNQLDNSTKSVGEYRRTLEKLKQTADDVNRNRQQLYERGQKLSDIITKLQLTKNDNDKAVHKLEEAYNDHQQLIASYHLLEDRIKEQEKQQEVALGKMIEAVELAEEAAAESQKNRMTRDTFTEELKRIKDLTLGVVRDFESAFGDHERKVKSHFEGILGTIRGRSNTLEAENEQLSHEKTSVQRQLEASTQENAVLKAAKADTGFTHFVEHMAALKAEIEAAYSKREQLIALNEKLHANANEFKSKLVELSPDTKKTQTKLNKKVQRLVTELESDKSRYQRIMGENSKRMAENQGLRSEIIQGQRAAENEIQGSLKQKENEIDEVKVQIFVAQKANAKAISEMQQAVLALRQHADKWKFKAQAIDIEAGDARQTAYSARQQLIDHIHELEEDLDHRKQMKTKCDLMMEQLNEQIKGLRDAMDMAGKKHRAQSKTITALINQQNSLTAEKSKDQVLLDGLILKVKRRQRALDVIQKAHSDLGFVDDGF